MTIADRPGLPLAVHLSPSYPSHNYFNRSNFFPLFWNWHFILIQWCAVIGTGRPASGSCHNTGDPLEVHASIITSVLHQDLQRNRQSKHHIFQGTIIWQRSNKINPWDGGRKQLPLNLNAAYHFFFRTFIMNGRRMPDIDMDAEFTDMAFRTYSLLFMAVSCVARPGRFVDCLAGIPKISYDID